METSTRRELVAGTQALAGVALPSTPFIAAGPSRVPVASEALAAGIERHLKVEEAALEDYECLARQTHDKVVAFLMNAILADERHQHDFLRSILASVDALLPATSAVTPLPAGGKLRRKEALQTAKSCCEFANAERVAANQLRKLAREMAYEDEGLPSLLLSTMAHDSEKHARIFRYLADRLETKAG